jgi:hypothetical protein
VNVYLNYRIRVKRHHWDGRVSTYPTEAALDFMAQPPEQKTLEGMQEIRLIAGYHWDKDLRDITAGVLSLRDGLDKKIWLIELPLSDSGEGTGTSAMPTSPTPQSPIIDTGSLKEKGEERPK